MKINYPDKKPSLRKINNREEIFCLIRKKWFLLSPEEWVRQNFLLYLTEARQYPSSLIAVEKKITVNELSKRFDILVYNQLLKPFIIIECKEMNTQLTDQVLRQTLAYYSVIQSDYLIITNGNLTAGFKRNLNEFEKVIEIPFYKKTD